MSFAGHGKQLAQSPGASYGVSTVGGRDFRSRDRSQVYFHLGSSGIFPFRICSRQSARVLRLSSATRFEFASARAPALTQNRSTASRNSKTPPFSFFSNSSRAKTKSGPNEFNWGEPGVFPAVIRNAFASSIFPSRRAIRPKSEFAS